MSTQSILGLFQQPELAADAMDGLKEAGFELGTFDVLTGTPYPEGAFGEYVPQPVSYTHLTLPTNREV